MGISYGLLGKIKIDCYENKKGALYVALLTVYKPFARKVGFLLVFSV